jgi:hypothetical protein
MDYEDRQPVWENLLALDSYIVTHWDGWWVDGEDGSINDNDGNAIVRDEEGNYWLFSDNCDEEMIGECGADLDNVLIRAGEEINV